jgi:hypothetical protein
MQQSLHADKALATIGRRSIMRRPISSIFLARMSPSFTSCEVKLVQMQKPAANTSATWTALPSQPLKGSPPIHPQVNHSLILATSSSAKRVTLLPDQLGPNMVALWPSGNCSSLSQASESYLVCRMDGSYPLLQSLSHSSPTKLQRMGSALIFLAPVSLEDGRAALLSTSLQPRMTLHLPLTLHATTISTSPILIRMSAFGVIGSLIETAHHSDLRTDQSRCPFSAHTRKTDPRTDLNPQNTLNHIIR